MTTPTPHHQPTLAHLQATLTDTRAAIRKELANSE